MRRRTFLQQGGALLAAGAGTVGNATAAPSRSGAGSGDASDRPMVLVIGSSPLAATVERRLAERYTVRRAERPHAAGDRSAESPDFDGVAALVNLADAAPGAAARELIDGRSRGIYALLQAAATRGVKLVVYCSSLRIMAGYDECYQVGEDWRPVPTTEPEQLSHYLGELVCREFAREAKLRIVVLRMADINAGETSVRDARMPTISQNDAAEAIRLTLDRHLSGPDAPPDWSVFHIGPDVPDGRFPIARAARVLNYRPGTKRESSRSPRP
jgi:hypothetical protein